MAPGVGYYGERSGKKKDKPCRSCHKKAHDRAGQRGEQHGGKCVAKTAGFFADGHDRGGAGPVHQRKQQRADRSPPGPAILD